MPRKKPPSEALFARAAELRAAGVAWETIAKEVNRSVRTVYYWPRKYPKLWADALVQAERNMTGQSDSEAIRALRGLLMSQDEKIRWHAAKSLIVRRLERDKIELKAQSRDSRPPLSSEARSSSTFSTGSPMNNSKTPSIPCGHSRYQLREKQRYASELACSDPVAVDCNGGENTGTRADLLVCDDVVDVSALHGRVERCRVADDFENNLMNLLEPEGRFWSLFTPWHGDDLTARQKKGSGLLPFSPCRFARISSRSWPAKSVRKRLTVRKDEIGTDPTRIVPVADRMVGTRPERRRIPPREPHERPAERPGADQELRPPPAVRRPVARPPRRRAGRAHRAQRGRQVHPAEAPRRPRGPRRGGRLRPPRRPHRLPAAGRHLRAGQTARDVVLAALAADHLEDHERETRAAITLTQVGFADPDQPADTLSGGWRKRLALARELARGPTSCSWTSRPTTSTCPASSGSNGCCAPRPSATSSPPTTGRSSGPSPARSSRSAASTPAGSSAPPAGTTRSPTSATSSSKPRPGSRRRSPTRSAARRSGSSARSRPSGGSRARASRTRPTAARNWPT